jgi:hypothetical protein
MAPIGAAGLRHGDPRQRRGANTSESNPMFFYAEPSRVTKPSRDKDNTSRDRLVLV